MRRASLPRRSALLAICALASCSGDPHAGLPEHVRRRHLALEGAPNFRDLGGYETADGQRVRWGLLYRSDNLAHLTPSDLARIEQLGIKLVCDFRSEAEKQAEPDRLPAVNPPAVAAFPIGAESFAAKDLRERISSGAIEAPELRQMMIEANRQFATSFSPQYSAMFERISKAENLPAVVHCTAGKDRAGFASALILTLLGVPRETVVADYMLTNHYTASATEKRLWRIRLFSLFRADTDALRPLFGVEPEYLEAAFEAVEKEHGDFDAYRRDALGIDDAELAAFRALALEGSEKETGNLGGGASAMDASARRIAVIAAMPSELEPFVKKLGSMTRETLGDRPLYKGRVGEAEVLATRTGMGTGFATEVTDRLLDAYDVDHVIAIGIAGGVTGVEIGDVITPTVVINGDDGSEHVPTTPRGITPRGKLRTSNTFSADKALMDRLAREGINAVDMETAAIGASAERHGCTWSVYRAISDKASDDIVSTEIFGLAHPDGSPNLWAALRFVARRPWMLPRLMRLGRDAQIAADAAADAALRELRGG